ncbi:MAG: orotidine-5'-phosphate decarboxylase [Gammaproteobacteria bacterium HGW-Gammaproteobacteria-1]|jgi:orotidine-5'-phosphate decarboxylase|nr:MAG: orotidine-5'-phosphate decarboxylase [Gammaproteobacteria bacterium HGW-Gammaproteobacteria-1]
MKNLGPRIVIALDYAEPRLALEFVERLEPSRCRLKVGKELFTRGGPQLVEGLRNKGYDIFLDLKFHDIPNTVAGACSAAADLGVWMVNVHALGGSRMMTAAREALAKSTHRPLLIAVTILTSMGGDDLREIGLGGMPADNVARLAALAQQSGLDGVVCSPQEVAMLRQQAGTDFRLVTPGIRPAWSAKGDQTRITTPADAVRLGSDYLVIGRPITAAEDPMSALEVIEKELAG